MRTKHRFLLMDMTEKPSVEQHSLLELERLHNIEGEKFLRYMRLCGAAKLKMPKNFLKEAPHSVQLSLSAHSIHFFNGTGKGNEKPGKGLDTGKG